MRLFFVMVLLFLPLSVVASIYLRSRCNNGLTLQTIKLAKFEVD